jgi:hypothetical protein
MVTQGRLVAGKNRQNHSDDCQLAKTGLALIDPRSRFRCAFNERNFAASIQWEERIMRKVDEVFGAE